MSEIVNVKSSDGVVFNVAKNSGVFKLSHYFRDKMKEKITGALPVNIFSEVFGVVIEWARHHENDEPYPDDDKINYDDSNVDVSDNLMDEWDKGLFEMVGKDMMYSVFRAASILKIQGLRLSSAKFAASSVTTTIPRLTRQRGRFLVATVSTRGRGTTIVHRHNLISDDDSD